MLLHLAGILYMASVSVSDVPSRLYAVSHVKGLIDEIQDELKGFKMNTKLELTKLETEGSKSHKNDTACQKQISQAHNSTRKLLNMLVEGEYNALQSAEAALENISLNEISQLWGTLAPGGKSRVKVQKEMADFREMASARIAAAVSSCKSLLANLQNSNKTRLL